VTPDIRFESLGAAHLALLADWFGRPHVAQWWDGPRSVAGVAAEYLEPAGAPDAALPFIALDRERPIGYIQSYVAVDCGEGWWAGWSDRSVVGIDQFIAEESALGQGLGAAMISAFVRRLFAERTVSKIVVDPSVANRRAIACYRKCGFRDTGIIATPDGDAVLMELHPRAVAQTRA
jgi:RimJ/RimL family protein N-acetyltransferase